MPTTALYTAAWTNPMYKMSSIGCVVVSPARVATAISFHSETTAGSPADAVTGVLLAKLVPGAAMPMPSTAAVTAPHVRRQRRKRRGVQPGGAAPLAELIRLCIDVPPVNRSEP